MATYNLTLKFNGNYEITVPSYVTVNMTVDGVTTPITDPMMVTLDSEKIYEFEVVAQTGYSFVYIKTQESPATYEYFNTFLISYPNTNYNYDIYVTNEMCTVVLNSNLVFETTDVTGTISVLPNGNPSATGTIGSGSYVELTMPKYSNISIMAGSNNPNYFINGISWNGSELKPIYFEVYECQGGYATANVSAQIFTLNLDRSQHCNALHNSSSYWPAEYPVGMPVPLTALPDPGYTFSRWEFEQMGGGISTSPDNPTTFDGNMATAGSQWYVRPIATATECNVSVEAEPFIGGTVTGGGTYLAGTTITVNAIENNGFKFLHWKNKDTHEVVWTQKEYSFVVDRDIQLVAVFTPKSTITTSVYPAGVGEIYYDNKDYYVGDTIVLNTRLNTSMYKFQKWTIAQGSEITEESSSSQLSVVIEDTELYVVATFEEIYQPYTITLDKYPSDCPCTVSIVTQPPYVIGQNVTVRAAVDSGFYNYWEFDKWVNYDTGETESVMSSYTFEYNSNKHLIAFFNEREYNVEVYARPSEGGIVTGGGTYAPNSTVTITATANGRYRFSHWLNNGNIISTDSIFEFNVNDYANLNFYAIFERYNLVTVTHSPEEAGNAYIALSSESHLTQAWMWTNEPFTLVAEIILPTYVFKGWYRYDNGRWLRFSTDLTYEYRITDNKDTQIKAEFINTEVTLNVVANPSSLGTVDPTTIIGTPYSTHTITATPIDNNFFIGWYYKGSLLSTDQVYTFEITDKFTDQTTITGQFGFGCRVVSDPVGICTLHGTGLYEPGDTVTVSYSDLEVGYVFNGWYNGSEFLSNQDQYSFEIQESLEITAHFSYQEHTVQVICYPEEGGIVTGLNSSAAYPHNTKLTLTAIANEGYIFGGWSERGTDDSSGISRTFTVDKDLYIIAYFDKTYTVTAYADPSEYGRVEGSGIYTEYDTVKLKAFVNTDSSGETEYYFKYWTKGFDFIISYEPNFIYGRLNKDETFIAHFDKKVKLSYETNPANVGYAEAKHGSEKTWFFKPGDTFSIEAFDYVGDNATGYMFDSWWNGGTKLTTDRIYTSNIYDDMLLTAKYNYVQYNVTASLAPLGRGNKIYINGTEVTTSSVFTVNYNSKVTFTATPGDQAELLTWFINGESVGKQKNELIITEATSIFGQFSNRCIVSLSSTTGGTVTGAGNYAEGETVTIEAIENLDYIFDHWVSIDTDGIEHRIAASNKYTFDIYTNETFKAYFVQKFYTVTADSSPRDIATITGTGEYGRGRSVTVECYLPSEVQDYRFDGWYNAGVYVKGTERYTFDIFSDIVLEARYNRIVDTTPEYDETKGSVTGGGIVDEGTYVTLYAEPADNCEFLGWYEGSALISMSNPITFRAGQYENLIALFERKIEILVDVVPDDAGTISGVGFYSRGATVVLEAKEAVGSLFTGWYTQEGALITTDNPWLFEATSDLSIKAIFETGIAKTVTLINDTPQKGAVYGAGNFLRGVITQVYAEVSDVNSYIFEGWYKYSQSSEQELELVTTSNTYTFKLVDDITYIAKFKNKYSVTLRATCGTSEIPGEVYGSGIYNDGDTVTIKAVGYQGYKFRYWYDTLRETIVYTTPEVSFNITSNVDLTAFFTYTEYPTTGIVEPDSSCGTITGLKNSYVYDELLDISASVSDDTSEYTYAFLGWKRLIDPYTKSDYISREPQLTILAQDLIYTDTSDIEKIQLYAEYGKYSLYNVTILTVGPGTVTGAGVHKENTSVTLTATPDTGYACRWYKVVSGGETFISENKEIQFTITEDCIYKVWFFEEPDPTDPSPTPISPDPSDPIPAVRYPVIVRSKDNTKGVVNPEINGNYLLHDSITSIAVPNTGYEFVYWQRLEGSPATPVVVSKDSILSISVNNACTYEAVFESTGTKYRVTSSVVPDVQFSTNPTMPYIGNCGESVTVSGRCNTDYVITSVNVAPEGGTAKTHIFTGDSNDESERFYLTSNVVLTWFVELKKEKFEFNVRSNNINLGTVSSSEKSGSKIEEGTSITVKAHCNDSFVEFVKWVDQNGTELSTDAIYTFEINRDITCIAKFKDNSISPELVYRDAEYKKANVGIINGDANVNKKADICGQLFIRPGSKSLAIYDKPFYNSNVSNNIGYLRAPTSIKEGSALFYNVIKVENELTKFTDNSGSYNVNYCSPGYQIDTATGEKYIWLCIYNVYDCDTAEFKYGWVRYVDNKLTDNSNNYYVFLASIKTELSSIQITKSGGKGKVYIKSGNVTNDSGPVNWNKPVGNLKLLNLYTNHPCLVCREEKRWYTTRGFGSQQPTYISNNDGEYSYDCLSDTGINYAIVDNLNDLNHNEDLLVPRFEASLQAGAYNIYDYCTGLQVVDNEYHVGIWLSLRYNYSNKYNNIIFTHTESFNGGIPSGTWTDERSDETYEISKFNDYNHTDIGIQFNHSTGVCKYGQSPNALYDFTFGTRDLDYIDPETGTLTSNTTVENRRKSHCNNQNLVLVFIDTEKYGLGAVTNNITQGVRESTYNHLLDVNGTKYLFSPVYSKMGHCKFTNSYNSCSEYVPVDANLPGEYITKETIDDQGFEKKWRDGNTQNYANYILGENDIQYTKYNNSSKNALRKWAIIHTEVNNCSSIQFKEASTSGYENNFFYDNLIDFDSRKGQNYEPIIWCQDYLNEYSDDTITNYNEIWTQYVASNNITLYNDVYNYAYKSYTLPKYSIINTNVDNIKASTLFNELFRSTSNSTVLASGMLYKDLYVGYENSYYDYYIKEAYVKPLSWDVYSSAVSKAYRYNRGVDYALLDGDNALLINNSIITPNFFMNIDYDNTREKIEIITIKAIPTLLPNIVSVKDNYGMPRKYLNNLYFNVNDVLTLNVTTDSTYEGTYVFKNWTINSSAEISTNRQFTYTVPAKAVYGDGYGIYANFSDTATAPETNDDRTGEYSRDYIYRGSNTDEESGKELPPELSVPEDNEDNNTETGAREKKEKDRWKTIGPIGANKKGEECYKLHIKQYNSTTGIWEEFDVWGNKYGPYDSYVYTVVYYWVYYKTLDFNKSNASLIGETSLTTTEYVDNRLKFTMNITRDQYGSIIDGQFYNSQCKYQYIFSYQDMSGEWHEDTEFWPNTYEYTPTQQDTEVVQYLRLDPVVSKYINDNFTKHNYLNCKLIVHAVFKNDESGDTYSNIEFEFIAKIKTSYDSTLLTDKIFRPNVKPDKYELNNKGLYTVDSTLFQGVAIAGFTKIYGEYAVQPIVENSNDEYINYIDINNIEVSYTPNILDSDKFSHSWSRYDIEEYKHRWYGSLGGGSKYSDAIAIPYCSVTDMGADKVLFKATVTAKDNAYDEITDQYSSHSFEFPYIDGQQLHGMYVYAWDAPTIYDVTHLRTNSNGICLNELKYNKNVKLTFKLTHTPIDGKNGIDITDIKILYNNIDWASLPDRLSVNSEGVYSIIIGNDDIDTFSTCNILIKVKDKVLKHYNRDYVTHPLSADCLLPLSLRHNDDNSVSVSMGSVATEDSKLKFSYDVNFITDADLSVSKIELNEEGEANVVSKTVNAYDFISRSGERCVSYEPTVSGEADNLYVKNLRLTNDASYTSETSVNKLAKSHSLFISTDIPKELL